MKIGFIGVGTMGMPMSLNLVKAGYEVHIYSRRPDVIRHMQEAGCHPVTNPHDLASFCDAVLLCVPDDAVVEELVASEQGLLANAHKGLIIVDHSTVSPYKSRKMYERAAAIGVHYLDAPVSGGPMGAEAATLTIMVGGQKEVFETMLPVFQSMGKHVRYMGSSGAGNITKLINQMLIGVTQTAISEGFVLGTKMGVDPRALYEVISTSTGDSFQLHRTVPNNILRRDFAPKFTIQLLHKDLVLANEMGRKEQVRLLASTLAEQLFQEACTEGHGGKDIAALILPLEQMNHVEVREK